MLAIGRWRRAIEDLEDLRDGGLRVNLRSQTKALRSAPWSLAAASFFNAHARGLEVDIIACGALVVSIRVGGQPRGTLLGTCKKQWRLACEAQLMAAEAAESLPATLATRQVLAAWQRRGLRPSR